MNDPEDLSKTHLHQSLEINPKSLVVNLCLSLYASRLRVMRSSLRWGRRIKICRNLFSRKGCKENLPGTLSIAHDFVGFSNMSLEEMLTNDFTVPYLTINIFNFPFIRNIRLYTTVYLMYFYTNWLLLYAAFTDWLLLFFFSPSFCRCHYSRAAASRLL